MLGKWPGQEDIIQIDTHELDWNEKYHKRSVINTQFLDTQSTNFDMIEISDWNWITTDLFSGQSSLNHSEEVWVACV